MVRFPVLDTLPEGATSFSGMMSPLQGFLTYQTMISHLEWATPILGVMTPFQGLFLFLALSLYLLAFWR